MLDYILLYFLTIKPTRRSNFSNLFWNETLHVSDSSSVHHQEFFHYTYSNGICHTGLLTATRSCQPPVAGSYENGNEPSGSVEGEEYVEWLKNY